MHLDCPTFLSTAKTYLLSPFQVIFAARRAIFSDCCCPRQVFLYGTISLLMTSTLEMLTGIYFSEFVQINSLISNMCPGIFYTLSS